MTDLNALARANANRFAKARLTRDFAAIAKRLVAAKPRYQAVEARTGVPWFIIAVIHMRESSQDWSASLAQGDPWNRVSTHVPAGRGPFVSWEAAAIDALVNCHPYLARKKDWSLGPALANLEAYNGVGYAARGRPSPYLWAGTDQYSAGKFVADGVYDSTHVDRQPGCAGLIKAMMAIDASIKFGPSKAATVTKNTVIVGTSGGGTAAAAHRAGFSPGVAVALGIAAAVIAGIAIFIASRRKQEGK